MRLKIERPTSNEWVLADEQNLVHYYATLNPALLGRSPAHQLVIAVLGEYQGFFCIEHEVYSNTFFATLPLEFAELVVDAFTACRSFMTPVELTYDFGGQTAHKVLAFHNDLEGCQ